MWRQMTRCQSNKDHLAAECNEKRIARLSALQLLS